MKTTFLTALVLLMTTAASAQTVRADRFTLNTGPCTERSGPGSPEGVVLGNLCDTYLRTDGSGMYVKVSGTGTNTGWMRFSESITTPLALNLTLAPAGDLITAPAGNDVFPGTPYTVNLGSLQNKYLTLHAAELWVETLVAQNTLATIGGRILVAPTTTLVNDLTAAQTSIVVKHNQLSNTDRIYMEANGKVEFMAITSTPSGSGPYTYTVTRNLDGSGANDWYAGDAMLNTGVVGKGFIDLYSTSGVISGSGPTIVGNVRTGSTYNQIAPRWAIGNLNGVFNYGADIYGAAFGDASATNVTVDATNGFRIRNNTTDKFIADTSGNLSIVGDLTVGTAGVIRSAGATNLTTGTGFYLAGGTTPTFRVGNPAGSQLKWDGTTLTIAGNGAGVTSISGANITTGSITADKINTSTLSAISANLGTVTAGSITGVTITGGAVTLDGNGIGIAQGSGTSNKIRWSDGSQVYSASGDVIVNGGSILLSASGASVIVGGGSFVGFGADLGTGANPWGNAFLATTAVSTLNGAQVNTAGLRATDLSGGGNANACVDPNGIFFRGSPGC